MDFGGVWEAVKTVGSIAGGITLGWKGFDAWDAKRNRLRLRTTQEVTERLDVDISYRAKSEHSGVTARVVVISPAGATLALLSPWGEQEPLNIDRVIAGFEARDRAECDVTYPMFLRAGGNAQFEVAAEILSLDISKAKISIELRDTATNARLLKRTVMVSPAARV